MRSLTMTRLRVLCNGKVAWIGDDNILEHETLSWADRWALFGVHSYNWWWVRRFGSRPCGCVHNPLTRNQVLFCCDHAWGPRR